MEGTGKLLRNEELKPIDIPEKPVEIGEETAAADIHSPAVPGVEIGGEAPEGRIGIVFYHRLPTQGRKGPDQSQKAVALRRRLRSGGQPRGREGRLYPVVLLLPAGGKTAVAEGLRHNQSGNLVQQIGRQATQERFGGHLSAGKGEPHVPFKSV